MWPFNRPKVAQPEGSGRVWDALGEQATQISALQSTMRLLEAEWTDVFEKFNRMAGRVERAKGHDDANTRALAEVAALEAKDTIPETPAPMAGESRPRPVSRHDLMQSLGGNHGNP